MSEIRESYRRIDDKDDRFDIEFWQLQGERAIFDAALEMIVDHLALLKYGQSREEAIAQAEALALRVIAERIEHGEILVESIQISFGEQHIR